MIVKMVQKERPEAGEPFSHFFIEGDRIKINFYPDQPGDGAADWSFGEYISSEEPSPVYIIRSWKTWPHEGYEIGYVRSGRIFLINDAGKTVDKYVI